MVKKHYFSAHSDMKTGVLCKVFLLLGCLLSLLYVIETLLHPLQLIGGVVGTILAFAILCLGIGVILYFFSYQFNKLSQIAKDVEENESLIDEEDPAQ